MKKIVVVVLFVTALFISVGGTPTLASQSSACEHLANSAGTWRGVTDVYDLAECLGGYVAMLWV